MIPQPKLHIGQRVEIGGVVRVSGDGFLRVFCGFVQALIALRAEPGNVVELLGILPAKLDQVAQAAMQLKGYTIEITGFASSDGSAQRNKVLSENRARAVINYLVETHNIPLRRIGTSFGFGELQAVADNSTREGREQNRRVEVKLLVSRGLNQNVEVRPNTTTDSPTSDQQ